MYYYEVQWFDDIDGEKYDKGLVSGSTIGEATDKICTYYGELHIISIKMTPYEDVLSFDDLQEEFK